jgi:sterol desaturase/sphingolipid hydroxylase (fatty acid hydroxylase superfamily)
MLVLIIALALSFLLTNLFGFGVHSLLHLKETKQFNTSHMVHHEKLYPPEDFFSDIYRQAGNDSTPKFFVLAALPMLGLVGLLWWLGVFGVVTACACWITMIGIGLLDNYLHDAFHIKNHWLNRVPWLGNKFLNLTKLHYLHHCDMTKNFGIFNFMWDRVFKSFWDKKDFTIPDLKK